MGSTQSQKLPTSKVPGGSASGAIRGSDFLSGSPLTDLPTPPPPPARSLLATPSGNIMRDGLASGGLKLSAPMGPGAPNRPKDVFQVETVLNGSGLLNRTPGTRFGDDTASAIGQGQQRLNRDHGTAAGRSPLKVDSLINPDGPTQTATRGLARQVADQWRGFEQRRKPTSPRPLTTPVPPPVSAVAMSDMDTRIKHVQDALTADQAGELTRLADGLSKTRKPGAVAGDISEAINSDGLKAVAEFQVVRDRLKKIGTADQIRALDEAVLKQVPQKVQDQLRSVFNLESIASRQKEKVPELKLNPALLTPNSETLSQSADQKASPTSTEKGGNAQSDENRSPRNAEPDDYELAMGPTLKHGWAAIRFGISKLKRTKKKAKKDGERYKRTNDGEFVQLDDGKIDFGEIDLETASEIGMEAWPIRLRRGHHDPATDKGEGDVHIEARHGDQIRAIVDEDGEPVFEDVAEYVAWVSENWTEIRDNGSGRPVLVVRDNAISGSDKKQQIMVLGLEKLPSADFYDVKTAGPAVNRYLKKMVLLKKR